MPEDIAVEEGGRGKERIQTETEKVSVRFSCEKSQCVGGGSPTKSSQIT